MVDWSMEPTTAWVPCNLQLANWTTEPAVCSTGLHVECASTEMFGNCLQTSLPVSKAGQLVKYAMTGEYDPVETSEHEFVVDLHYTEKIIPYPIVEFKDVAEEYKIDIDMMGKKIHRYPAGIQALDLSKRYTVPMVVSIGPYHHTLKHLKKAQKVKHVAAFNCIRNSGFSVEEMYSEVVQVAHRARMLYDDDDDVAGIADDDFLPMMFFDACFLVQYMLIMISCPDGSSTEMDASFFDSNDNEIYHDIMLLENQIPWPVVQAVMKFVNVPLGKFVDSVKACLQDRKNPQQQVETTCIMNYEPPHLLGLLRFYIVGENCSAQQDTTRRTSSISFSVGAVELAEIGVTLKPSETTELIHMGLKTKGTFFAELSLAPLSLDSSRASWLINMAALELCRTSNFTDASTTDEDSAVCSYLLLLAMLVSREEDVQELRTKRLLQGGGLNNKEALDFFTSVQGLRLGSCYIRIMKDIQEYRENRRTRTNMHAFFYRNIRIIVGVISALVTIVSILGTLLSLKSS